jgi:ribonucleoside-triphosphate reductase
MLIIKKNGKKERYSKSKIMDVLMRAAKYSEQIDKQTIKTLVAEIDKAVVAFQKTKKQDITTLDTNNIIEQVLVKKKLNTLLEALIHYRIHIKEVFKYKKPTALEIKKSVDEYTKKLDWRVKENSNSDFSFSGLMGYVSGKVIGNYTLNEIYPSEIAKAHREGDYHIHDLSCGIVAYCAGWSLEDLLKKGFGHVPNKISSTPAKHLSTIVIQIVNFIGVMQMEHAGAQAFSSVDTYLAPFIKYDKLNYKEIKQQIQQLVYSLNVPSRWGSQAPFTNITLDWICPKDMRKKPAIVGGVEQPFTYGDCQEEMDMINQALLEVMLDGDSEGRIFYYPIPTYNITKDFKWDHKNTDLLMEVTRKYGYPYFANFINSDMDPTESYGKIGVIDFN